jgi:hypothetical protein
MKVYPRASNIETVTLELSSPTCILKATGTASSSTVLSWTAPQMQKMLWV